MESQPEWWMAGAPAPVKEPKVKRKPKPQPTLFGDDWISNLLASDLFRQQMDAPR